MRTHRRKRKVDPKLDFILSHRAAHKATRTGDVALAERWMRLAERQLGLWNAVYDAEEAAQNARPCPGCGYRRH